MNVNNDYNENYGYRTYYLSFSENEEIQVNYFGADAKTNCYEWFDILECEGTVTEIYKVNKTILQISCDKIEKVGTSTNQYSSSISSSKKSNSKNSSYTNKSKDFENIILEKGHPVYLDTIEVAEKVWGSNSFININKEYKESDVMEVYDFNGTIDDIVIYFKKFNKSISLDNIIYIAKNLLPSDKINRYYQLKDKFILKSEETGDIENFFYIYTLNQEGKEALSDNSKSLRYNIVVEVDVDNKDYTLRIHSNIPNWATRLSLNGFVKEDWIVNF